MGQKTTSVRLDEKVVRRVRKYIKGKDRTIGGFISSEVSVALDRLYNTGSQKPVGNDPLFNDGRFDDTTAEAMNE